MPDHNTIYAKEAEAYDRLISAEDYEGNIIRALRGILPLGGLDVIDNGAGSGRMSSMLAQDAKTISAYDASSAMLQVLARKLSAAGFHHWRVETADLRSLPAADRSADLVTAGWAVCYVASANVASWEDNLQNVIAEMRRVLRPGGSIIILETLGTGHETPKAPSCLKPYYELLEHEYGFSHTWIRTDYQFESVKEAEGLVRFFFGDQMADQVAMSGSAIVPECTGIWWLHSD